MKKISPSELTIVTYLWQREEEGADGISFKEIFEAVGNERAKQTINTLLTRLITFGYVHSTGNEGKRLYHTLISRNAYAWILLSEVYPGRENKKILSELRKSQK